jgi:DsbC/DsbD-like thiol-disulfide interchange protein
MEPFHRLGRNALLAGLTVVCLCVSLQAQGTKSDSKVKITTETSKPDAEGKQTVTLTLVIEKGWHLYANPIGNMDLESAQTKVALKADKPLQGVKIDYPMGKIQKDKVVGDYNIYEGTVVIKAQMRRTPGDTSAVEASVSLQACNENNCLLPATVKVAVK